MIPLDGELALFENNSWLRGLHLLADFLIGWSYVAISLMLLYLVWRGRKALPFHYMFVAFGAFIIFCGLTHFGHVLLLWDGEMVWPLSVAEALTVVASVATAIGLPPLLPRALALLKAAQLSEERLIAARTARQVAHDREELLSVIAHELRNPLGAVKGYTELLQRRLSQPRPDPARVEKTMRDLNSAVARAERLLDDLADVSRLQTGRFALRRARCDLVDLAAQTVERWRMTAECTPRHSLTLDAPPSAAGWWDAGRLQQVVANLISNALKYSPDGGAVVVRVRDEGGGVLLSVSDQGLGVPPDAREAIFQPFTRAVNGARAIPGEGIGLYVSRQIVEQHGGTLTVDSSVGGGSTFTVRLPKDGGTGGERAGGDGAVRMETASA